MVQNSFYLLCIADTLLHINHCIDLSNTHTFFFLQVHVNLLVLEARLQAELIYALRAVMQYMKQ